MRAYLERESRKFTGQFASADVLLEGHAYAEALAMKMTEENVSKISTKQSSVLFSTQGDWDSFLSTNDPLLVAASRAAPVQRGATGLSFIHVRGVLCVSGVLCLTSLVFVRCLTLKIQENDPRIFVRRGSD